MARLNRHAAWMTVVLAGTAIGMWAPGIAAAQASEVATPTEPQPVTPTARTPADPAAPVDASSESIIDVVFVLDTTGSMSGLIEGAKQKIWSIANTIATAEPRPTVRMGLVGYRDRGDAYVTTLTTLTDDLDAVFADLMKFEAGGGGDGPESVNQALLEGVTLQPWSDDPMSLKLIYLVGDAPPHMDYEQDTKYAETCSTAAARGIIINTIQCGVWAETTPIWQEIARLSEGEYFAIQQDGGVTVVATPFDEELATLGASMAATACGWGTAGEQRMALDKAEMGDTIAASAPTTAQAERASYFIRQSGKTSALGQKELVDDVTNGRVNLEDIKDEELPPEFQGLTLDQQRAKIAEIAQEREKIQQRIVELTEQREAYLKNELAKLGASASEGFDAKVTDCLREQAARKGIVYGSR